MTSRDDTQERLDLCNLSNYKLSTWTWTFLEIYTKVTTITAEESAITNKQCTCINSALPMGLSAFVAWLVGVGIGTNSFTFSPELPEPERAGMLAQTGWLSRNY
mgnify:CR=1 FL=1